MNRNENAILLPEGTKDIKWGKILGASQSGPTFSGHNFSGPKILAGVGPEW